MFEWVVLLKWPEQLFIIVQLINCACLEENAGTQTHKNPLMEIGFKECIDEGKGGQVRINDGLGA